LLAQVATTVDVQLGHALSQSPGWQTLMTILKESGASSSSSSPNISKRPASSSNNKAAVQEGDNIGGNDERLTKRFRGVSLRDKFNVLR